MVADAPEDQCLPLMLVSAQRPVAATHRLRKLLGRLQRENNVRKRARWGWGAVLALSALATARGLSGRYDDALYALALLGTDDECFAAPLPLPVKVTVRVLRDWLQIRRAPNAVTEARRARLKNIAQGFAQGAFDADTAFLLCALVDGAALIGLREVAEALHECLLRLQSQGQLLTPGAVFLLPRVLGLSAQLLGRDADAEAHFAHAISVAERMGAAPELGRSLLDYARFVVERRPTEHAQAGVLAQRAAAVLVALGIEEGCSEALRIVTACGVQAPHGLESPPPPAALSLNARETQSLSDAKFRAEALIVHEAYFGFGALESLQRGTFRSR